MLSYSSCERPWDKGRNGPFYSTAVVKDLGTKAGMAHFILQQLPETSKCPLHFAEVNSALLDPSAECSAEVGTTCNESKSVYCMFSRPINDECFFFTFNITARYMKPV